MNDLGGESLQGPFTAAKPREAMNATYGKQMLLEKQFPKFTSLQEALAPLQKKTGIDFFRFYAEDYNIPPLKAGVKQEPVRTSLDPADSELQDVCDYFVEQKGRSYYRYIDEYYHPEKPVQKCTDFIILEESLPKGKMLVIFDYKNPPAHFEYDSVINDRNKIKFRKLIGCYAIVPGRTSVEDQAIDLSSFWTGAAPPRDDLQTRLRTGWNNKRTNDMIMEKYPAVDKAEIAVSVRNSNLSDENRLVSIGITDTLIDAATQMDILKERGRLVINDEAGPQKWYQMIYTAAAFSQNEGDKTSTNARSDLPLGAIRARLGESEGDEQQLISKFEDSAKAQGTKSERIQTETRDWLRNRLAVGLYVTRKLHQQGIDFFPEVEYRNLDVILPQKIGLLQKLPTAM